LQVKNILKLIFEGVNIYLPRMDAERADAHWMQLIGAEDLVGLAADAQEQAAVGGHVDGGAARVAWGGAWEVDG
jgi:hypothetical protein